MSSFSIPLLPLSPVIVKADKNSHFFKIFPTKESGSVVADCLTSSCFITGFFLDH
jgi:hypothetical protein